MDKNEALILLSKQVSGYFGDDFAVELMRSHYLESKSSAVWIAIQLAFATALEQCSDIELNNFVAHEFNLSCTSTREGREFLSYIYNRVFNEQN